MIEKIKQGDKEAQSKDLVQDNIEKLKVLFPEIVTEGKIDFKVLQAVLGEELEEGEEFYRFTWAGKAQARREAHKPSTGTLRPAKEESVNWDTTQNLYIEGDNLEVLKLLQKSYANKVKMIYIDPPYNTGKDFVYKDNYKDNLRNYQELTGQVDSDGNKMSTNSDSDGRYHSNWLNMMYPRLRLAKNLLKDDGVIFISIDDNEVENLRRICDEIFGMNNSLFTYTIKVRYEGKTLVEDMLFQKVVENVLVYSKSKHNLKLVRRSEDYSFDKFVFDIEEIGESVRLELGGKKVEMFNKDSYKVVKKKPSKNLFKEIWASGSILDGNSSGRFFRDYLTGRYREDGLGVLYKVYGIGGDGRSYRYFTGPKREGATKGKYFQGVPNSVTDNPDQAKTSKPIVTFLDLAGDFGNCRHEGNIDFRSGKKPLALFEKLFEIIPWDNNDVILDFFSGSASTAHASIESVIKDNILKKFIMVQLPEKTEEKTEAFKEGLKTISEIGKERIRRVIKKIKREKSDLVSQLEIIQKAFDEFKKGETKNPALFEKEKSKDSEKLEKEISTLQEKIKNIENSDLGFKVFKLDSSNVQSWSGNPDNLEQELFDAVDNIKTDRSEEDVLYEILLKYGLDLTLPIEEKKIAGKTVFNVGMGALFICLAKEITKEVAEGIGEWKMELNPAMCRVIFKDSGFKSDADKTNAAQNLKRYGITEIKSI